MNNPVEVKRMTAQNALELTIAIYKWWEKKPGASLEYWPEWKSNGGSVPNCFNNSPLCRYVAELVVTSGCYGCLLTSYWQKMNKNKKLSHLLYTCLDSPHEKYSEHIKPKYIRRVRRAAERKLKKIMENNND